MSSQHYPVHGAGLGLRRAMLSSLADQTAQPVDFWEVAPENWINVGGRYGKTFRELTERFPFICHGLSLSIGGPAPLDQAFLQRLKRFLREHRIRYYSEHLSYCSDDGHLYDLLPVPFTGEAVRYVADRIRRVQDILEQRIAIENVSYYAAPGKAMEEIDFLTAVLQEADCDLLLDVNNIYVNSINHRYDAETFLQQLPAARIRYVHVAGHYREAEDLIVDTHGADVIDPVWQLLEKTYQHFGVIPTLLERDFNLPPLVELLQEVEIIHALQSKWQDQTGEHAQHG
ncbi:DUF692 domain-containing protein [Nitrosomonas sp. Is24]|uniref:HvfB family MNIO-type RiPP peptide maturase n=1 Tax=Nitrosomonas sp. Is24 TaxID=3080533 RepID=UPI00294B1CF9|nr:DUF692 domain-containing protein [Nitrosomonas sp. Is24]MDV6342611.1 DUF692 domain-containing protein [Nitrosomonas sp. Is24]